MLLTLIETEDAYLVVFDNNPDDWIARFSKHNRFPAQEWAQRMATLYNLRISGVQGLPCCLNMTKQAPPSKGKAH